MAPLAARRRRCFASAPSGTLQLSPTRLQGAGMSCHVSRSLRKLSRSCFHLRVFAPLMRHSSKASEKPPVPSALAAGSAGAGRKQARKQARKAKGSRDGLSAGGTAAPWAPEKARASPGRLVPGFVQLSYLCLLGLQQRGLSTVFLTDLWQRGRWGTGTVFCLGLLLLCSGCRATLLFPARL